MPACGQGVGCGVCDTPELWCGATGLCARVRACAGAAESLHTYIHTRHSSSRTHILTFTRSRDSSDSGATHPTQSIDQSKSSKIKSHTRAHEKTHLSTATRAANPTSRSDAGFAARVHPGCIYKEHTSTHAHGTDPGVALVA